MTEELPAIQVGDGVTINMWSDRHAGTVVFVSKSGREVHVQQDNAKRTDKNGMSESQSYEYERNPNGRVTKYTLRTSKDWKGETHYHYVTKGCSLKDGDKLTKGRREYFDYSF